MTKNKYVIWNTIAKNYFMKVYQKGTSLITYVEKRYI